MSTSRNRQWAKSLILLLLLLALSVIWGCRAFEPVAVVVNKAPNTFIIGAPMEHAGGYYHYHVFWYGTDDDGQVVQYVWAVTDTTIQEDDTSYDEEDLRFNPALDASHLEIAHYTTRTDSIFDFRINQGPNVSYDITLHMVAKDDFGDFDRTPARLHFFSNALGTPEIAFFRREGDNLFPVPADVPDTVGFGQPYTLTWSGGTPNIRGYDPDRLAEIDTVYPYDDGLFGYKWQLSGDLGNNCVPSLEDCWHPRRFNEAEGDSYSYFADLTQLMFRNDNSGTSPFEKRLPAGIVDLRVNSIDVAGVEVPTYLQGFQLQVNYDPITIVLNDEPDLSHADPDTYPYYIQLNDNSATHHPFGDGERIPDNSYVIVKAMFKDDPRDVPLGFGGQPLGMEGFVQGNRHNLGGGEFGLATEASDLDTLPTWGPDAEGWSADTLGFLPGPRSSYTFNMVGVDEHGQRDGTPSSINFEVGYPPCVQCIEIMRNGSPSDFPDPDLDCMDTACMADTKTLYIAATQPPGDNRYLVPVAGSFYLAVNKLNGSSLVIDAADLGDYIDDYYTQFAFKYQFQIFLHGQDDRAERYPGPDFSRRVMSWRYQVTNHCDPYNEIRDGGGTDDITRPTFGVSEPFQESECGVRTLCIYSSDGLWVLRGTVGVPLGLVGAGPAAYYQSLLNDPAYDLEAANMIFKAATRQIGPGSIQAVARDQTQCGFFPTRPARYNLFRKVRPPERPAAVDSWRTCNYQLMEGYIKASLGLELSAMESNDGEPVEKNFTIVLKGTGWEFAGYEDCGVPGLK